MASGIHSNSRVGKTSLDPHCLAEPRSTEVAGSCGRLVLHTPTLLAGVVDRHQSESGERGREGEGAEVQPQSFLHQLRSPRLPRLLRQGSPAPALYCLQVSALITEASSEEPRRKSVLPPWQYLLHSANSFFVPPRLRPSSGKFSSKSSPASRSRMPHRTVVEDLQLDTFNEYRFAMLSICDGLVLLV